MKRGKRGQKIVSPATGERGQVIILMALLLTSMAAMLALTLDLGYVYAQRRAAQKAADAAAQAGALALGSFGSGQAQSDALYYASVNGFDNDGTTNTVTVNIPPSSPPAAHTYNSGYVQVIVTSHTSSFFARALNILNLDATAQAVAASSQANNYTIFLLDKTASPSLQVGNSASLTVNGGSIVVDSSANSGSGAIQNAGTLVASTRIDSVGTYTGSGAVSPAPTRISVPAADPFAGTPKPYYDPTYKIYRTPDGTALTDRSGSYDTVNTVKPMTNTTLYPGTYWGGIRLTSNSVTVQLQPGVYIMAGGGNNGGFYANGGTVQGSGVFIYNTSAPGMSNQNDQSPGSIYLGGNATLNLQAATTGVYGGLLLFQDPSDTQAMTIQGGPTSNLMGTIYTPSASLSLGGSGNTTLTLQLVAKTMSVSGSNTVTVNMPSARYDPPGPSLVE